MQADDTRQARFAAAHEAHAEEVFRFFAYRLADRERAKELAQETFMRAWQHAIQGKEIRLMRPFLFTIASNLFKNELRDRKPVVSLDAFMELTHTDPESNEPGTDARAEASLLIKSMEKLDQGFRDVLRYRYFDGLTSREIAQLNGETEIAVAVRIHRALKKLKEIHNPLP